MGVERPEERFVSYVCTHPAAFLIPCVHLGWEWVSAVWRLATLSVSLHLHPHSAAFVIVVFVSRVRWLSLPVVGWAPPGLVFFGSHVPSWYVPSYLKVTHNVLDVLLSSLLSLSPFLFAFLCLSLFFFVLLPLSPLLRLSLFLSPFLSSLSSSCSLCLSFCRSLFR